MIKNIVNAPITSYIFNDRILQRQKSSAFETRAIIPTVHLGEKEMSNVGTVMCPIRLCFECRLIPCESPLFCFDVWVCTNGHAESHAPVKSYTIL